MELLREFVFLNEMADVEQEILLIEGMFDRLLGRNNMQDEMLSSITSKFPKNTKPKSVTDLPRSSDISAKFEEAGRRLDAAKRGLSLANKLKSTEERKQHRSRIMANLNRLRALVKDIERSLASSVAPAPQMAMAAAESVESTETPIQEFIDADTANDLGTDKDLSYLKSLEARAATMKKMLADNPADSRLSALLRKLMHKIKSLSEGTETTEEPVVESKVVSGYVVGSKKSDSVLSKKFDEQEDCEKEAAKMNKDQNVDHYHCKPVYKLGK